MLCALVAGVTAAMIVYTAGILLTRTVGQVSFYSAAFRALTLSQQLQLTALLMLEQKVPAELVVAAFAAFVGNTLCRELDLADWD